MSCKETREDIGLEFVSTTEKEHAKKNNASDSFDLSRFLTSSFLFSSSSSSSSSSSPSSPSSSPSPSSPSSSSSPSLSSEIDKVQPAPIKSIRQQN